EAHMGSRVLRPGDGFFVAAEAPYTYTAGPQGVEVLEFRHATSFDIKIRDKTLEQWKPIIEAVKANGERWAAADAAGGVSVSAAGAVCPRGQARGGAIGARAAGAVRAAVVGPGGRYEVISVPDPVPGPGELLLRVTACGLCGSDLKARGAMPAGTIM